MSRAHDKDVSERDTAGDEPPGKVEFDARGKAIWRWARDKLDSTTVLLKRLENDKLALEPTQRVPVVRDLRPPGNAPSGKAPSGRSPSGTSSMGRASGGKPASIAAERTQPRSGSSPRDALGRPKGRDGGGGFDPYNSR